MKVLLVQPPLSPATEVQPPVGLSTLAAWLLHHGHVVQILDLDLEIKGSSDIRQDLYGELLISAIKRFCPHVVGVTSMYSNSLQAERLIRAVKHQDSDIVTIAGGSHFGALASPSLLRIPELDFAIEGEAELGLSSLLAALESQTNVDDVPALHYRVDGTIRVNPAGPLIDLAELPAMWVKVGDAIQLERYAGTVPRDAARRIAFIEAGRGCPFDCTFCATAPFWRRTFRVKPTQRILEEIRFLYEQFDYNSFVLIHDLLTVNPHFISEFCDVMLDARLPVEWMANSRTDMRLDGLLPKMKAAGCWKLFHGIESASERIQRHIDKGLNVHDAASTVATLRDHGISSTCSFVIGFPEESPAELGASIGLGARLKILGAETVQFHRLRLWPPARLTKTSLEADFDLDSLRIEYPFTTIAAEDIAEVRSDRDFFAGYFPPQSQAGSLSQLAQVEMFFHHAIALAPMTISVLAEFAKDSLIPSFYATLNECCGVVRADLDWESGNLSGNWEAIGPLLWKWVSRHTSLDLVQQRILAGVMNYESCRLAFITRGELPKSDVLTSADNWVAFKVTVDIPQILQRVCAGVALTPEIEKPGIVVQVRQDKSRFSSYMLEMSFLPDVLRHKPELLAVFN